MFTNKLVEVPRLGGEQIYMSRIIASWRNKGGDVIDRRRGKTSFYRWCTEVLGISDSDTHDMITLATNGKLELEVLTKHFLNENKGETSE